MPTKAPARVRITLPTDATGSRDIYVTEDAARGMLMSLYENQGLDEIEIIPSPSDARR